MNVTLSQGRVSATTKYFHKYRFLVDSYIYRVVLYDKSMTYDDVRQELEIKMLQAIKAYGRKYLKYKRTGRYKPVPLKFYLKSALSNKVRDIIRQNNADIVKGSMFKVEEGSFDYGMCDIESDVVMDLKNHVYVLNGYNLLASIPCKKERACMALYLAGYNKTRLNSVFKKVWPELHGANKVINKHVEFWKNDPDFKDAVSSLRNDRYVGFMFDEVY